MMMLRANISSFYLPNIYYSKYLLFLCLAKWASFNIKHSKEISNIVIRKKKSLGSD